MKRILGLMLALATLCRGGTLVLKRAWVTQFMDRATIEATFRVDHAHPRPNAAANDGDMHVAGRADREIGLPMVSEIMNAIGADEKVAVDLIHATEKTNGTIPVSGAWRIRFEHPPTTGAQKQFDPVPMPANTNPDHCFEIHPLTKAGTNNLAGSLRHIPDFPAKDAKTAFTAYEKLTLTVQANDSAVTLVSPKAGYNYVVFTMLTKGAPKKLGDEGAVVLADILAADGDTDDVLARDIRMIFVPGSKPLAKLSAGLGADHRLKVLGIPRVNLNAVNMFIDKAFPRSPSGKKTSAGPVTRKLPYEIIVVAVE